MEFLFPDYPRKETDKKKEGTPRRCRVNVLSPEKTIEVDPGTLLIDALREGGIDVPQQCGGFAICGWCKVRIVEGEENLSAVDSDEERLFDWGKLQPGERASCRAEVRGDVTVA